jgi:hypothetical protein
MREHARKPVPQGPCASADLTTSLAARLRAAGAGAPLAESDRAHFEPRLGVSLAHVRVHVDPEARTLTNSLGAEGFTRGSDVYIAKPPQRSVLAHELAHVAQRNPPDVLHLQPAYDAKATAKKINAALTARTVDKVALLAALAVHARDATQAASLKSEYKTEFGKELEADLKAKKLDADTLSRALFLLHGPVPETRRWSDVTIDAAGTEEHKANVGGGTISVHKGVDFTVKSDSSKFTGAFSVAYSGAGSADTHVLQTIWAEIVATKRGKDKHVPRSGLGTAAGPMELTTNPKSPNMKLDARPASPFYEEGSSSARTATGLTIFDRPSEFTHVIMEEFDDGATKVVERDHFDIFLIQEEKPVYYVSVVVEWVYTSKTASTRTTLVKSGKAVTALPAMVKKQLVKQHPRFEYIR